MKYLVTLKRNHIDFTSKQELNNMYNCLFKRVLTLCKCTELDSRQRLHTHSMIEVKKVPYFKRYMRHGWRVHFKKINKGEELIVNNYINKNNYPEYQNEMQIISYAHYNYMFID